MTPASANSYSVVGNGSGSGTSAIDLYRTYSKKNFGVNLPLQDPVAPGMGEPEFVDAANGDFRLRGGQLAIDAAAGTDLDHDANGAPTPVDGDGNGTDVADLGAFEYQRAAPKVVVAGSNSLSPGVVGSFTATASDADGDAMTYAWDFGDGSPVDTSGLVVHHAYAAGRFILKFTATDAAGVSGVATTTIDVPAPPVTAPPRDTTPPNVTVGKFTANKKGTGFSTKVSCPATESKCAIKLSFTAKTGKSGKFKKYANDVSVSVPGGKSATVNVKLNSAALGVIKQKGKVAVKVVLLATDGDSNSTTRTLSYTAKKGKTGSAK
jgi:PKD repeat protein